MPRRMLGMTLIEVLIALAIIGIALTAVIKAASQNIRGTGYLQNKTIALWVAEEVMNEASLGLLTLTTDSDEGEVTTTTMLGQDWYWRASETSSANPRIKKLRVRVYAREPKDDDTSALIDLDGYRYHEN
jgi:general secretion pathway protein I